MNMLDRKRQQEEAKRQIALAQSERKAAADQIQQYREQNTLLRAQHKKMHYRLRRSIHIEAKKRGESRKKELKESPAPSLEDVYLEVECHQNTLANSRHLPWTSGVELDYKLEGSWTSLDEAPEAVIKRYQAHATHEQLHSEIKTNLDLERLPSDKFATNDLILHLAQQAYNILRPS